MKTHFEDIFVSAKHNKAGIVYLLYIIYSVFDIERLSMKAPNLGNQYLLNLNLMG